MIDLAKTGVTMLCVTHEMGFARKVAHRVLFMDGGEIIESNEPEEFFTHPHIWHTIARNGCRHWRVIRRHILAIPQSTRASSSMART